MNARYEVRTSTDRVGAPCDLVDIIAMVDSEHEEPLRALEVGEEHEIPQVGAPHWFVVRTS
jgi:hypothetical protein